MNIKTTLKTSVAAAALFALAAPVAAPASADIKNGNKNTLTISGYVAKSLWYADDGEDSQLFITDGSTSRSRVRWIANGRVNEDVSSGAFIEMDIPLANRQTNATLGAAGTLGAGEANTNATDWAIRHQFVWVDHKKFGKVSLGHTDAAANGNTEALLSGTTAVDLSSNKPFCSSCLFVQDTAGVIIRSTKSVNSVIDNLDFTSRDNVIRYDSPRFMGLRVSASLNDQGGGEVGARYSGKFAAFAIDARIGYTELSSAGNNDDIIGASVAVLHDSGLNASVAYSVQGTDSVPANTKADPWMFYVSGGYKAKIFKIGGTNLNVGYNKTRHLAAGGDEGEAIGVTVLQEFDPIGANIAVFYRNYDLENKRIAVNRSFDSIDVFGVQTVFNF